jgi:transcriptional regulator with XRE-family HTH domain
MGKLDTPTRRVVAHNIKRLMVHQGWTQEKLARQAGVNQKTISNIVSTDKFDISPTLESIDRIAFVFGLPVWHLCLPDLPLDQLVSTRIERLVRDYLTATGERREEILRVAEREAHYSRLERAPDASPAPAAAPATNGNPNDDPPKLVVSTPKRFRR